MLLYIFSYILTRRTIKLNKKCSGTHYKGKNCDPKETVDKLKSAYAARPRHFFPESLMFTKVDTGIRGIKKSNGGWSDPRDHQLCKSFIQSVPANLTSITIS